MIRLLEFRDLDRIMEIWLEENLSAHPFIKEEYWRQDFKTVHSVLPNAEVYVFKEDEEVRGFIGMDTEHIVGIFVTEGHRGQGIGYQLISEVKRKKHLSLHVYEKNTGAVAFYRAGEFRVRSSMTEKGAGEQEHLVVLHKDNELNEGTQLDKVNEITLWAVICELSFTMEEELQNV